MNPRPRLDDTAMLARRLRALAKAEAVVWPPPRAEAAVMAAWDAAHRNPVVRRPRRAVRVASAVAAGVVAAAAVSLQPITRPVMLPPIPPSPFPGAVALHAMPAVVTAAPEAVRAEDVLPSGTARGMPATLVLVGEPLAVNEPVRVIRMRVAGSSLASFGIRSLAAEPPETVDLDLIVGEDGVARAVRVAS